MDASLFCRVTENLAPSELKKLRNKQRKQRRKAELERQQAAQAQEKREQHNKSRQQTDPDLEQPTLDELIPEKLERVSTKICERWKYFYKSTCLSKPNVTSYVLLLERLSGRVEIFFYRFVSIV